MPSIFRIKSSAAYDPTRLLDGGGAGILRFTTTLADTLRLSSLVRRFFRIEIANSAGDTTGTVAANIDASAVPGAFELIGNDGDNILTGGVGTTAIIGNGGNDTLILGGQTKLVNGGTGDDTIILGDPAFIAAGATYQGGTNSPAGDTLEIFDNTAMGGAVFDLRKVTLSGLENLLIFGGDVQLSAVQFQRFRSIQDFGGALGITGRGTITGPAALDFVTINYNPTTNSGSLLDLSASNSGGVINGSAFNDNIIASNGFVTVNGGDGNDFVRAGAFGSTLNGDAGRDVLLGGDGLDFIDGGTGADLMAGGLGDDFYIVDDAGDRVIETAGQGIDTIFTSLTSYSLSATPAVENLAASGIGNFTLTGNALANVITGGIGNDTLIGGDGNDTLIGGGGRNTFLGGNGDDTIQINPSELVAGAVFDGGANGAAGDTVFILGGGTTIALRSVDISNVAFTGIERLVAGTSQLQGGRPPSVVLGDQVTLTSTQFNSFHLLRGDSFILKDNGTVTIGAGETLSARSVFMANGGQTLDIAPGTISPITNFGQLSIFGGNGNDHITFSNSIFDRGVIVNAGSGNDIADGSSSTFGFGANGEGGDDQLLGGSGDDQLNGGDGNDWLYGGLGNDFMTGGTGADIYSFYNASNPSSFGNDIISDFSFAEGDLIDLRGRNLTYADLQLTATSGGGTTISADAFAGGDITVANVNIASASTELASSRFLL